MKISLGEVDDHYFAVGTAAFESLIEAWLYLPAMILLSQMCPAGLEAVLVAILAGAAHLGAVLSRNFGAALLEIFDVHPVGAPQEGYTCAGLGQPFGPRGSDTLITLNG